MTTLPPPNLDGRPLIAGKALWLALGYSSAEAFRQAACRQTVPVPTFTLPYRRGRFAFVEDVIAWQLALRKANELEGAAR